MWGIPSNINEKLPMLDFPNHREKHAAERNNNVREREC